MHACMPVHSRLFEQWRGVLIAGLDRLTYMRYSRGITTQREAIGTFL